MPADITGAPTEVELNGKTYLFYPLTDKDLVELDNWLQARVLKLARASLDEYSTPAERELQMTVATREAMRTTFMSLEGVALLSTAPGISHICWMSLRKNCEITEDEVVMLLMGSPENFTKVLEAYDKVNAIPDRLVQSTKERVEKSRKKRGITKNPRKARRR